ncbi:hypothetical protein AN958_07520 [Leucoagaricus sp. SymC.cos]|nr:hypothetical protein AN958_07520 [Leucoagaricus sp. SymC.cos]
MPTSSSSGLIENTPGSPTDTSSLRAAALRTLKLGKRRRPAPGQTQDNLLARPVPQDSLQLDYGQDDNTIELPQALPQAPSPSTSALQHTPSAPVDVDMREEGEISDEEFSQVETSSSRPAPMQTDAALSATSDRPLVTSVSPRLRSPTPALLARISMPQSPASNSPSTSSAPFLERPLSYPPPGLDQEPPRANYFSDASSEERGQWPDQYDNNAYLPDQDNEQLRFQTERYEIYPGLIMTGMEYTAAKDIVLDLLGWGVPPHYLVDCGLSRDLVFCVFTELQLKLPPDLDGFPPGSNATSSRGSPYLADEYPGDNFVAPTNEPIETSATPGMTIHPETSTSTISHQLLGAPVNPTQEELQNMERQRRQELMARKKAVASRKAKSSPDIISSTPALVNGTAVPMALHAPSETVESFLSSIEPVTPVEMSLEREQEFGSPQHFSTAEGEEIPGLGNPPPTLSPPFSPPLADYTPPPSANNATRMSTPTQSSPELVFKPPNWSRGTRRPVASDFVDAEDCVSPPNGESSKMAQRRQNSLMNFARVTPFQRRLVIDLSDSEDDGRMDPSQRPHTIPNTRSSSRNPVSSRHSPTLQPAPQIRHFYQTYLTKKSTAVPLSHQSVLALLANAIGNRTDSMDFGLPRLLLSKDSDADVANVAQVSLNSCEHSPEPQIPLESPPESPNQEFQPYQSTLSSYPLLAVHLTPPRPTFSESPSSDVPNNAFSSPLSPNDRSHSSSLVIPDLQLLRVATVMSSLDTSGQLCQYEIPGGGVCRDGGCNNVHISKVLEEANGDGFDMSDFDITNFLLRTMPLEWQSRHNVTTGKMVAALTLVRQFASPKTLNFEERVRRALLAIEPAPPVPKAS